MSRSRYRHRVLILRRVQDSESAGGYAGDEYGQVGETSCEVRDESPAEFAAAQSAGIEHMRTFTMRKRTILEDDLLVWKGIAHRVRTVDGYLNMGREIRVRASVAESRYSVRGQHGAT